MPAKKLAKPIATHGGIDIPWIEKYRPKQLKDVVGVETKKDSLVAFIKAFPAKRGAVLIGPPGIGKTTLAYAVAHDMNRDIIEMNASDARSSDDIKKKVSEATKSRSITDFIGTTKGKIILIDEVDGISGNEDRGGISTLVEFIKRTEYPMILTCNEWLSKLKPIFDECEMIKFQAVRKESIAKVLHGILTSEGLEKLVSDETIQTLAENAGGDFRSAINDLQSLAGGLIQGRKVAIDEKQAKASTDGMINDLKHDRDKVSGVFEGIVEALKSSNFVAIKAALSDINMPNVRSGYEWDTILSYLMQNISKITKNSDILAKAADLFATADMMMGYLKQTQDWSILAYFIDLIAAAVARVNIDAKNTGVKFKPDQPQFRFFKEASLGTMVSSIGKVVDSSDDDVKREIFPILKELINTVDSTFKDEFFDWLNLDGVDKRKITSWASK